MELFWGLAAQGDEEQEEAHPQCTGRASPGLQGLSTDPETHSFGGGRGDAFKGQPDCLSSWGTVGRWSFPLFTVSQSTGPHTNALTLTLKFWLWKMLPESGLYSIRCPAAPSRNDLSVASPRDHPFTGGLLGGRGNVLGTGGETKINQTWKQPSKSNFHSIWRENKDSRPSPKSTQSNHLMGPALLVTPFSHRRSASPVDASLGAG